MVPKDLIIQIEGPEVIVRNTSGFVLVGCLSVFFSDGSPWS